MNNIPKVGEHWWVKLPGDNFLREKKLIKVTQHIVCVLIYNTVCCYKISDVDFVEKKELK